MPVVVKGTVYISSVLTKTFASLFSSLPLRDVSSVELLMKYHQGIRAEIETRVPKFTECVDLGRALLARNHRDSAEVRGQRRGQRLAQGTEC